MLAVEWYLDHGKLITWYTSVGLLAHFLIAYIESHALR